MFSPTSDEKSEEEILELFEELTELVEVNSQNKMSLCRMGGLKTLLEMIVAHKHDEVRKAACRVFNTVCSNEEKV